MTRAVKFLVFALANLLLAGMLVESSPILAVFVMSPAIAIITGNLLWGRFHHYE